MSPMAWTACTVSTTITLKGTSSLHTLASFCPRDTTARTSCRSSTAGEESQTTHFFLVFFTVHAVESNFNMGFDSRLDAVNCKRVNVAGNQAASYLQRLLQLKYPGHLAAITLSRVEELLHEHSYTAVDYHEGAVCQCKHAHIFIHSELLWASLELHNHIVF